mgnify:FL=1
MAILSCDSAVQSTIFAKMGAAGRMGQILYILVVVDNSVVSVMRHHVRMEEVDFSDNWWLVDLDIGLVFLVDPVLWESFLGVGLSYLVRDVGTYDIVVEEHFQLAGVICIVLFWNGHSAFPNCHVVLFDEMYSRARGTD